MLCTADVGIAPLGQGAQGDQDLYISGAQHFQAFCVERNSGGGLALWFRVVYGALHRHIPLRLLLRRCALRPGVLCPNGGRGVFVIIWGVGVCAIEAECRLVLPGGHTCSPLEEGMLSAGGWLSTHWVGGEKWGARS